VVTTLVAAVEIVLLAEEQVVEEHSIVRAQ
jgi:hypothetical protein